MESNINDKADSIHQLVTSNPIPIPIQTLHTLLRHPLLRLTLKLLPPPRKRRPPVHHIANGPQHALLIHFLTDIAVGTDDVEFARRHLLDHVLCDLRGGPCA